MYHLDYKATKKCVSLVGDLLNLDDVSKAMNGVSMVIHTAGVVDIRMFPDVEKLKKVNVEGSFSARNYFKSIIST